MIKVADVSGSNKKLKPIRRVIVSLDPNSILTEEKYRVVIQERAQGSQSTDKLIYAKGKINLNYNNTFKDSNNVSHSVVPVSNAFSSLPTILYAFYNDGFYKQGYNLDEFNKYSFQTLSDIITKMIPDHYYAPKTFVGWYLSPTPVSGERKINTIADIYSYTTLFDMSTSNSLPTITLYARWNIPTVTLQIHNLNMRGTMSSVSHYNEQTGTWSRTSSSLVGSYTIIYSTDVDRFIRSKVKDPQYRTWAYSALDGTSYETSLRNGPQGFKGWAIGNSYGSYGNDIPIDRRPLGEYIWTAYSDWTSDNHGTSPNVQWWSTYATNVTTIHAIPCFETIVIVPKFTIWANDRYYTVGGYYKKYTTQPMSTIWHNVNEEWTPDHRWDFQSSDSAYYQRPWTDGYNPVRVGPGSSANDLMACYSATYLFTIRPLSYN